MVIRRPDRTEEESNGLNFLRTYDWQHALFCLTLKTRTQFAALRPHISYLFAHMHNKTNVETDMMLFPIVRDQRPRHVSWPRATINSRLLR